MTVKIGQSKGEHPTPVTISYSSSRSAHTTSLKNGSGYNIVTRSKILEPV